jgi:hypothetical protein
MNPAGLPEAFARVLLCIGVALVVSIVIFIFYLLTLQKALGRVSPENRLMAPGLVWLSLIPCFTYIWAFFVARRVPDSLRNEFRYRGRDDGSDYGKAIGLTVAVLNALSTMVANFATLSGRAEVRTGVGYVSLLMGLLCLVLFIVFWVKIANYSSRLAEVGGAEREAWLRRFDEDEFDRGEHGGREPPLWTPPPSPDSIKEGDQGRY